ncbi:MAG: hypothetical protein ACTHNH_21005 [Mesorhizobium sp.]
MTGLARRLDVPEIEEQRLVTLVRPLVVGDRGAGMVPVAFYDDAAATLAGVQVAEEGLLADAMGAAPSGISVKLAVLLGFG